jgi:hypothetical protein
VVPSHSRPQVSDDNPFSEAQFKTLKYRPDFPDRFGAYEGAETFCQRVFPGYNTEQRHGVIAGAAAIANAVEDAVADLGVIVREVPVTSARLHAWLEEAKRTRG